MNAETDHKTGIDQGMRVSAVEHAIAEVLLRMAMNAGGQRQSKRDR